MAKNKNDETKLDSSSSGSVSIVGEEQGNNTESGVTKANHAVKFVGNEATSVIAAVGSGVKAIFSLPKKLFGKKEKENVNVNASTEGDTSKPLYKQLADKINNISFVKKSQEKKEASLVPLVLNPEVDSIKSPTKNTYKYLVRDKEGKLIKGYFPAFSKMDVYSYLSDSGMTIYEIETNKSINFLYGGAGSGKTKMKTKDLVFWLTQLSTYIRAGIPLTDSVKVIAQQDTRKKYKPMYESLIYELTMGETFSEALKKQGNAFPGLLVNMIKSSEMMGNIEDTLDEMSDYYQEIEDNRRAIVSALAYPCIVLVFAIGIVIFMLSYIVPKFVDVYDSMGAELNPITVITLNISDFIQNKWMYVLAVVAFVIIAYTYSFKNIKAFRKQMQTIYMKLPVIGPLIVAKEINMFSRTFASLQKNNVLLTDSIEVLSKITNNEVYKELEMNTIDNLIKGNKMSDTFKNNWAIPDIAYFMIVTGESTGELAQMLDKVADFYQKQQKNLTNSIKTFIEPIMIIFLAVMVGFILIAILVPMFGIYSSVA